MAAPRKVDWERIEPDWRAGIKSVQQIADEYTQATGISVTRPAINKHFKGLGITRDLSARIQAKAEAMVSAAMVTKKVSLETTATDAQIIDANAQVVAEVQISHRQDIQRSRKLTMTLLAELEATTENQDLFEQLGELLFAPDDKGVDKLNELYRKVISMPGRVDSLKKLAETLKVLIDKEREAYGINGGDGGKEPGYEAGLKKLLGL